MNPTPSVACGVTKPGRRKCILDRGHRGPHTSYDDATEDWVDWVGPKLTPTSTPTVPDPVFTPTHYRVLVGGHPVECAPLVDALRERWATSGLDVHRLAVTFEYLFRCGTKDDPRQDALKALNQLHRAIYGTWFTPTPKEPTQ